MTTTVAETRDSHWHVVNNGTFYAMDEAITITGYDR